MTIAALISKDAPQVSAPSRATRVTNFVTWEMNFRTEEREWWIAKLWKDRASGWMPLAVANGRGDTPVSALAALKAKVKENATWLDRGGWANEHDALAVIDAAMRQARSAERDERDEAENERVK